MYSDSYIVTQNGNLWNPMRRIRKVLSDLMGYLCVACIPMGLERNTMYTYANNIVIL